MVYKIIATFDTYKPGQVVHATTAAEVAKLNVLVQRGFAVRMDAPGHLSKRVSKITGPNMYK